MVHKCPGPPTLTYFFHIVPIWGQFPVWGRCDGYLPFRCNYFERDWAVEHQTGWSYEGALTPSLPMTQHITACHRCYWGAHRNNGVHVRCSSIPRPFFLVLINFPTHELVWGILERLKIVQHFHVVFDIKFSNICGRSIAPRRSRGFCLLWRDVLCSCWTTNLFVLLFCHPVLVMSNHLGPSHLITSRLYTQVKMVPLISHLSGI